MPHSSGGGSHSGGSHGGSHRGGSGGIRYSRTPFSRSRRFRYRDRRGNTHYIYASDKPKPQSIIGFIFSMITLLPFLAFGVLIFVAAGWEFMPKDPLKKEYICTGVHMIDNINVIDNYAALEKSLEEFEDVTGICPCIVTVHDSDWKDSRTLERYAYNYYVDTWEDEQHFLIVYSEPEKPDSDGFLDWSWEGMQGDDTDPILTEKGFSHFQNDLMNGLYSDDISVGDSFRTSFDNSLDYIMQPPYKDGLETILAIIVGGTLWFFVFIFSAVSMIKGFIMSRREYSEVTEEYQGPDVK